MKITEKNRRKRKNNSVKTEKRKKISGNEKIILRKQKNGEKIGGNEKIILCKRKYKKKSCVNENTGKKSKMIPMGHRNLNLKHQNTFGYFENLFPFIH